MQASISGTMKKADTKFRYNKEQNTFTNWVNVMLKSTKYHSEVKDLQVDLKDGLVLIALLEALADDEKIGNYNKRPNIKASMMDNLDACFKFMDSQNIKLVNIGSEDIYSGELKLILALIWTLFKHYKIRNTLKYDIKEAMISFFARVCNVEVSNFTTDWNDGIVLSRVIEYLHPGLFPDITSLSSANKKDNCNRAITSAKEKLSIPPIISADDMADPDVEEKPMMMYLSYYIKPCIKKIHEWAQSLVPHRAIRNMSSDWCSGVHLTALINVIHPGILPDLAVLNEECGIENITKAIDMAEHVLGIKPSLKPDDMAKSTIDEMSVAEYLAPFMSVEIQRPTGESGMADDHT